MAGIAFVFSGQGSQYAGMGREIYELSPAAKRIFHMADRMRSGTMRMCFEGPQKELSETVNTQPCLFTVSLACAEALREAGVEAQACAGFSLGEITALAFTGILSYEEGFDLVCRRAAIMQEEAEKTGGCMAAVLKLSAETVNDLCARHPGVYPACYNSPGQVTVSGDRQRLVEFILEVESMRGRAVLLDVGGAFHCTMMSGAGRRLSNELDNFEFEQPRRPLYMNATGEKMVQNAKALVAQQLNSPVQWEKTIRNMADNGTKVFVEMGAKRTLAGLIEKILPGTAALHVEDRKSYENTLSAIRRAAGAGGSDAEG